MKADLATLMDLLYGAYNRALPEADGMPGIWQPIGDVTHCNAAVQFVCEGMGYPKMNGLMANQMFDFMANPANGWITQSDELAQERANAGILVIAAWKNSEGHGHVNVVCPGLLELSGSWGKKIPKVMNVGRTVFFGKRISFAFAAGSQPTYFALAEQI